MIKENSFFICPTVLCNNAITLSATYSSYTVFYSPMQTAKLSHNFPINSNTSFFPETLLLGLIEKLVYTEKDVYYT